MTVTCRSWWRNCALETDPEMQAIDQMEDHLAPLPENVSKIRNLISSLELCHHKAERWIHNIIFAIGSGETQKGLGTHPPVQRHPMEREWENACACLSAWCVGCVCPPTACSVGPVPASQLVACLGERTPLKVWQVQRVIKKIHSFIYWPQSLQDPDAQYRWVLFSEVASEPGGGCYCQCPESYKAHEDFWMTTVQTIIHDVVDGQSAELSLGLAIDMLWPCHWRFAHNLLIVLGAIGANLNPSTPFAACGRNISLFPHRQRMRVISQTLQFFCKRTTFLQDVDLELLSILGKPSDTKKWLAASLDKTIRLQLDPPPRMQNLSALSVPDWIKPSNSVVL